MAPKDPNIVVENKKNNDKDNDKDRGGLKTTPDVTKCSSHSADTDPLLVDLEKNGRSAEGEAISMWRQVALNAGLLASDGGLVLMQLLMLPTLQTLGVPVAFLTLPGCLSGSMALLGVPLLGYFSDRGDNPRGRKKPVVVFSALVFITGFSLVVSGCGLQIWIGADQEAGLQSGVEQGKATTAMTINSYFTKNATRGEDSYNGLTDFATAFPTRSSPDGDVSHLSDSRIGLSGISEEMPQGRTTTAVLIKDRPSGPPAGLTTTLPEDRPNIPEEKTGGKMDSSSDLVWPVVPEAARTTPPLADKLPNNPEEENTPEKEGEPSLPALEEGKKESDDVYLQAVPRETSYTTPVTEEPLPASEHEKKKKAEEKKEGEEKVTSDYESEEDSPSPSSSSSSPPPQYPDWMADPLGLAIPLGGLLAILGFAFIDMGNDLNNTSQKSLILASTAPAHHVSLLVMGVQMSAVGGCVTALLGVTDLPEILTRGTSLDTVPGKTLLQCAFFVCLTLLCVLTTLLATPSAAPSPARPHPKAINTTSPTSSASSTPGKSPGAGYGSMAGRDRELPPRRITAAEILMKSQASSLALAEDALESISISISSRQAADRAQVGHQCRRHDNKGTPFSRLDSSVPSYHQLDTSCDAESLQLSTAADTDCLLTDSSLPRYHRSCQRLRQADQETREAKLFASNSIVYYAIEDQGASSSGSGDCEEGGGSVSTESKLGGSRGTERGEGEDGGGRCVMSRPTRRLALICVAMFFFCGTWQSFNVCITDYLGKVIYGGDPDADPDSQSYAVYQQGMRTGSSGVLLLNCVYVMANVLQKKLLTTAGPKMECVVVCGLLLASLITLLMTDSVAVFYVTSAAVGFFRSTMYTIPFMLANEICQEAARCGRSANVGSTMALVTTMIPLSNILVSSMTGPLISSTGDPASPLCYSIAATSVAALVFVFT